MGDVWFINSKGTETYMLGPTFHDCVGGHEWKMTARGFICIVCETVRRTIISEPT